MLTRRKLARKIAQRRQKIGLAMLGAAFAIGTTGCANAATSADNYIATGMQVDAGDSGPIAFPLDDYLGLVIGIGEQEEEARIARNTREQELLAQCMTNKGFDYKPHLGALNWRFTQDSPQEDNLDWVTEFGYGHMTEFSPVFFRFDLPFFLAESDPNYAIFQSLSETEQVAWREALLGRGGGWSPDSCLNVVSLQLFEESPSALFQNDEFLPLFEAWQTMRNGFLQLVTEEHTDWANCMADAGNPGYTHRRDAANSITDEYISLVGSLRTNDYTLPEFVALKARGIELALADYHCRVSVDFANRQNVVRYAVEAQFLNDHRAALEALRDAAEQRN